MLHHRRKDKVGAANCAFTKRTQAFLPSRCFSATYETLLLADREAEESKIGSTATSAGDAESTSADVPSTSADQSDNIGAKDKDDSSVTPDGVKEEDQKPRTPDLKIGANETFEKSAARPPDVEEGETTKDVQEESLSHPERGVGAESVNSARPSQDPVSEAQSRISQSIQDTHIEPVINFQYNSQGTSASTISVDFQTVEGPPAAPVLPMPRDRVFTEDFSSAPSAESDKRESVSKDSTDQAQWKLVSTAESSCDTSQGNQSATQTMTAESAVEVQCSLNEELRVSPSRHELEQNSKTTCQSQSSSRTDAPADTISPRLGLSAAKTTEMGKEPAGDQEANDSPEDVSAVCLENFPVHVTSCSET